MKKKNSTDKWRGHFKVGNEAKSRMRQFMTRVAVSLGLPAHEVWEKDTDGYGCSFLVERADGNTFDVYLKVIDAGDSDTGVYGKEGAFHLSVVEEGGRLLCTVTPYNYTPEVRADYKETDEGHNRLSLVVSLEDDLFSIVDNIVDKWKGCQA